MLEALQGRCEFLTDRLQFVRNEAGLLMVDLGGKINTRELNSKMVMNFSLDLYLFCNSLLLNE